MTVSRQINFSKVAAYLIVHVGAMICFFLDLDWGAVGLALLFYLIGGLSWTVGIHRGLIHRAYKTHPWVEAWLALLGALSGLGGPISSARTHFLRDYCQANHGISGDEPPTTFWENYFRSPFFWDSRLIPEPPDPISQELYQRRFFRCLEHRWILLGASGILLYVYGGLAYLAWCLFARVAISLNVFACFDYFCHSPKWGRQRFELIGAVNGGRNHWLIGLIAWGEGWHNNHHAMPASPRMGIGRYELDLGYFVIWVMKKFGLAWDVIQPVDALRPNAVPK